MQEKKARKHKLSAVPDIKQEQDLETVLPSSRIDEAEICSICYGSGIEIVPGKGAKPCECRRRDSEKRSLDKARLPLRYSKCHFGNFNCKTPSQELAFTLAMRLAKEYPAVDQGLLFSGSPGVGKTHLAVAVLKGLFERGIRGLFCEFGSLLKEIQNSYNSSTQSSEWRILAPVFEADVLVLDELGASKPTLWVQETMYHIINTRYNDKRLTIFTTNFPDQRPDQTREILEDRIGVRLRSRLFEMCRTVPIDGDDHRKTFDRPSRS